MKKDAYTLVVLAAGIGSRFGGDKQVACAGPHGEMLMEYSAYDAAEAGFTRVVFVLRPGIREYVERELGSRMSRRIEVRYAEQDFTSLPAWFELPPHRERPYGTVHALLCAEGKTDGPFATANADDFYGAEAFRHMRGMLGGLETASDAAMVPYLLKNTLSENGGVTRGICRISGGKLTQIEETRQILRRGDGVIGSSSGEVDGDADVSMNIWGFRPEFYPAMRSYFEEFLRGLRPGELRSEALLPVMVSDMLARSAISVRAEASEGEWFGMTYREDRDKVAARLAALCDTDAYPERLF